MTRLLITLALAAALAGCSTVKGWFGSDDKRSPLEVQNVGPNTKEQVAPLPDTLIGDEQNALHTNQQLRGDEDPGGN